MADGYEHVRRGEQRSRLVAPRRVLGRSGRSVPRFTGDRVLDGLTRADLERERDQEERTRAAPLPGDA